MSKISMREMLEAGAHFGHSTEKWNPKMRKYIYGPRNGVHIIDLQQTVGLFKDAYEFLRKVTAKGGKVLFVGTKKQAQEIVKNAAADADQYFVNYRWLGGMLTNFKTIKQSIERYKKLQAISTDGTFEKLPKKEVIKISRELEKLQRNLCGIENMSKLPKAIFIIDPKREHIAVTEALNLDIPIVAMVDTNCDPTLINYPIPANDDSIRAVSLFANNLANACKEGEQSFKEEMALKKQKDREIGKDKEESLPKPKRGPTVEVINKVAPKNQDEDGLDEASEEYSDLDK